MSRTIPEWRGRTDDAKAAAQTDYESRIRAALSSVPAGNGGEVVGYISSSGLERLTAEWFNDAFAVGISGNPDERLGRTIPLFAHPPSTERDAVDEADAMDENDLASDERWNAGVNYAVERLCDVFGVDPKSISWDAATETLDGDVSSVLCNVLIAAYGEEWSSQERDTAIIRAALKAAPASRGEVTGEMVETASEALFQLLRDDWGGDSWGNLGASVKARYRNIARPVLRALLKATPASRGEVG